MSETINARKNHDPSLDRGKERLIFANTPVLFAGGSYCACVALVLPGNDINPVTCIRKEKSNSFYAPDA